MNRTIFQRSIVPTAHINPLCILIVESVMQMHMAAGLLGDYLQWFGYKEHYTAKFIAASFLCIIEKVVISVSLILPGKKQLAPT